ncbi:asparagine synthase-related protein [Alkalihalobacterium elongatum]|uniref:asparagine synthase-related protein n=1 Tax=Alkalihalobacterium elongatum TaxID=2675466 RepID=UPI001C2005C6|nr:asparagine synthase-related protein [Alkalihalobacterium elongatum]
MSAITGVIHFNKQPINKIHRDSLLEIYSQYIFDDIGFWFKENVFLSCHAQWITPESIGEKQPYYDYVRQLVITSDAIIDNREELFSKLQIHSNQQKYISDSQLILLAYEKWGEEIPQYLLGDFAFMIWDEKKQKLFGARDFSGARTLYFYKNDTTFVFSTTIKPLFSLPYIEKKINEEWLAEFLVIPSMVEAVDMNSTVYKSIKQLPPSHTISVVDGKVTINKYNLIDFNNKLHLKSNQEYEEAFREVFEKAVTSRLRTYGKVGAQLSGGLDSGSVVSFAANALKKENKRLNTYSFIPRGDFEDWTPNYFITDERPFIKETVDYVGNISDQYMNFAEKSPFGEINDFLELLEMPYKFFENSFWLKGINEKAQEQGIKILLNGARGNHSISFGSWNLTINHYASLLKRLKWIQLYNELNLYCKNYRTGKSVILPVVAKRAFPYMYQSSKTNTELDYSSSSIIISPELAKKTNVFEKLKAYEVDITGYTTEDEFDFRKKHFEQLYSWNKTGTVTTKLSLRYSLWDRDPTNDIRVIRFCLAIPNEQYVQGGMERSLVRRAMENYLPNKVRLDQQKRGLQGADVILRMTSKWKEFREELQQLSQDPNISSILNNELIKNAIKVIGEQPKPELLFDENFRLLTRSLIVYRFLKTMY